MSRPNVEFSKYFKADIINMFKELKGYMDLTADMRWQENQWTEIRLINIQSEEQRNQITEAAAKWEKTGGQC